MEIQNPRSALRSVDHSCTSVECGTDMAALDLRETRERFSAGRAELSLTRPPVSGG
jgi:hypothetical protein